MNVKCPACGNTQMLDVIGGYHCLQCEDETGEEHFYDFQEIEENPWDFLDEYENEDEY